jgi:hypothetical protein
MRKTIAKRMEKHLPDLVRHASPRHQIPGKDVIGARAAEELAEQDLLQVNSDEALEVQECFWRLSRHR